MASTRIANELGLLSAKILVAIKHQNDDVSIYMGQLLRHLNSQQSVKELEQLIGLVEDQSLLLKSIEPEFRFNLLLAACQGNCSSVANLLTEQSFIEALTVRQLVELLDSIIHSRLSEKFLITILKIRQLKNADELANVLNKHLLTLYDKKTLPILCHFGVDPLIHVTQDHCDSTLMKIFIKNMDHYKDIEIALVFKQLIMQRMYLEAERVLKAKPEITAHIKKQELEDILYRVAYDVRFHSEVINLIKLLIFSGVDFCVKKNYGNSAFDLIIQCSDKIEWLVSDEFVNLYPVQSLIYMLSKIPNSDIIQIIFDKKLNILKEYFKAHPSALQSLYDQLLCRKKTKENILLQLLNLGANPTLTYFTAEGKRINALNIAFGFQFVEVIRYSLNHWVQQISANQFAEMYIYAVNSSINDIADWLASSANQRRLTILQILEDYGWENKYIEHILKLTEPTDPFIQELSQFCFRCAIKESSLLDFFMQRAKYEWIVNFITINFQHLSLLKILDATQYVLNEKNDNAKRVEHMKLASMINDQVFISALQTASTIMDIMTILEQIKNHPIMTQHVKLQSTKEIKTVAVKCIMHMAKFADEIKFPDKKAYENTIAFLRQQSRFQLFVNYDKDFIRVIEHKLKFQDSRRQYLKKT